MRTAALSLVLLAMLATPVFAPPAAPAAHWLWAGDAKDAAYLRQTFHMKPGLVKAILLGAADRKMEVFINGKPAGTIEGTDKPTALDITTLVQLGNNVVAAKAAPGTGASAATMMIEFTRDGGQTQWLVTDETWVASSKESKGWEGVEFNTSAWQQATSLGAVGGGGAKLKANPFDPAKVVDAYNSWRLATMNGKATDPATITAPPGFTVDLIRSGQLGEDSWIALAFDPQGRITIAKERKGLIRFTLAGGGDKTPTVARIETINDSLMECRGLLYAHGALYVNANNSKTLVRLRDSTPGDNIDYMDENKELLRTDGGVGHGRNHLTLGPDGAIYITHGNDVRLPKNLSPKSPYKGFDGDQLLPCEWDSQLDSSGEQPPGGHVVKMDKDGTTFELIAAGFRNPMGVAFNKDGEMFTYDADMELDLGTPWYRPTRINHVVSGGEYGWRRGTGKWPVYYADSMGSVCDIGLGSPTAVRFGTGSRFPRKYQNAMFVGDWAYGRILAVHLSPRGATYTGGFEPFLAGRPLNVTDLTFGPDGAMYFVTGGRQTQSGLYRVRYTGPAEPPAAPSEAEDRANFAAETARFKRGELEAAHQRLAGAPAQAAVKNALANLGSEDPSMRFAARVALEHQDPALWTDAVLAEREPTARIIGLVALARVGELKQQGPILQRLGELPFATTTAQQQLMALRAYTLAFVRMGKPSEDAALVLAAKFDPLYPSRYREVNHELCELLVFLGSSTVRERTFALIEATNQPEDLVQYLYTIRKLRKGWTRENISAFFRGLNKAAHQHPGRYYTSSVRAMRVEFGSALNNEMKAQMADLLAEPAPPPTYLAAEKAVFVRDWKLEDLTPALAEADRGRSFEKGREAFAMAQCAACHRFGSHVPGTEVGPDLTAASSRFNRRDLLESIVNPSKAIDEKFKQTQVTLTDGTVHSGHLGAAEGDRVILYPNLLARDALVLSKKEIASQKVSEVSPMPTGLLSVLTKEQVLDLLAYIESGGKPEHAVFGK